MESAKKAVKNTLREVDSGGEIEKEVDSVTKGFAVHSLFSVDYETQHDRRGRNRLMCRFSIRQKGKCGSNAV